MNTVGCWGAAGGGGVTRTVLQLETCFKTIETIIFKPEKSIFIFKKCFINRFFIIFLNNCKLRNVLYFYFFYKALNSRVSNSTNKGNCIILKFSLEVGGREDHIAEWREIKLIEPQGMC